MKEWDNRVQFSPKFNGHIQDMLNRTDCEPDAIELYQDDTGSDGRVAFVYDVSEGSE